MKSILFVLLPFENNCNPPQHGHNVIDNETLALMAKEKRPRMETVEGHFKVQVPEMTTQTSIAVFSNIDIEIQDVIDNDTLGWHYWLRKKD